LINPQLTSLCCNFSYGFKKGHAKYFLDTKTGGAILCISHLAPTFKTKAHGLNREDAMDSSRWRKQIGIIDDHNGCEWVNVSFGTSSLVLYCGCRHTPQYLASSRWHDWSVSTGVSHLLVTPNDREGDRLFLAA